MQSEGSFLRLVGRSANVILRFGKAFFFTGEGRVCVEGGPQRSRRLAALAGVGIVEDLGKEKSFDVPDVSFALDWVNITWKILY